MVFGPDKRVNAAQALVLALRKANPIVIDAAAKETAFRFQSGMLGAGDAQAVFEQLRLLGWAGALPDLSTAPPPETRYLVVLACRLCGCRLTTDHALNEERVRKRLRDLSPPQVTLHQDLTLPGDSECLGVLIAQGLVIAS